MATEKTDVVIVGVGAGGGILAAELGKAGIKVIGLERGPCLTTQDFTAHDELRYFQRLDLRPNPKRQPVTWRPNANARATPLPRQDYGNLAGGGTVHYGSVSWRLHEDDFRARSNTIERYGAAAIPADSSLADWPLGYTDLEPYYDRAEYELGVSGKAGNLLGRKIDGGNVFESPRRRDYPLPPLMLERASALFDAGAKRLGHHPFSTPRAIMSEPYNGRAACTYLLRLLPGLRLPCRGKILDPRHQAARSRREREFQAHHRGNVLPREQRWQSRDRLLISGSQVRVLLRPPDKLGKIKIFLQYSDLAWPAFFSSCTRHAHSRNRKRDHP
jgi:choline dehydrogenase-like flavoprotein